MPDVVSFRMQYELTPDDLASALWEEFLDARQKWREEEAMQGRQQTSLAACREALRQYTDFILNGRLPAAPQRQTE
jgi:hypothetical protein